MIYNQQLSDTLHQTISVHHMIRSGDSVLVGVSGGPDSVALLCLLSMIAPAYALRLGVAHLNHCLRGADAQRDAKFTATLAKTLNLPYYMENVDVRRYQRKHRLSLEEAARELRYAFFYRIMDTHGFDKLALGHHADDNAELVLMYLFRGSGPLGVSGIPPVRDKIIRPLIHLSRMEILDFLSQNKLTYVSDSTNADPAYLRNRIRHELMPILKNDYNPNMVETLSRFADVMRHEEEWAEYVIHPMFEKCLISKEKETLILSVNELENLWIAPKRRILRKAIAAVKGNLRRITYAHMENIIHLLQCSESRILDLPDRIRIERSQHTLCISKKNKSLRECSPDADSLIYEYDISACGTFFIKEIGISIRFSEMPVCDLPEHIRAEVALKSEEISEKTAFFDKDKVNFPLKIRNFRPGDRFTPLGMTGSQKVKKYFIDQKIPRHQRARFPILLCNGKIIWLAGHRIDNAARIKASTKNVLRAELI